MYWRNCLFITRFRQSSQLQCHNCGMQYITAYVTLHVSCQAQVNYRNNASLMPTGWLKWETCFCCAQCTRHGSRRINTGDATLHSVAQRRPRHSCACRSGEQCGCPNQGMASNAFQYMPTCLSVKLPICLSAYRPILSPPGHDFFLSV
jgi:hypothetical protein